MREQLARFAPWAADRSRRVPGRARPRRQLGRDAARARHPLRPRPLRDRALRPGPVPGGPGRASACEPALELRSYVAEVKRAAPGESAGYGRRFVARAPDLDRHRCPIGYGDGVRRGLTNNAEVLDRAGGRYPLVGTVSMDNVTVDLGPGEDEPAAARRPGGRCSARGHPAEEWARRLGTINYEVTCGISARVPRAYAGGERAARRRSAARSPGTDAWLVGGAVRDRLLGRPTDDLDVALDGDAAAAAAGRAPRRPARPAAFALSEAFGGLARRRPRPRLAARPRPAARRGPRGRPRRARLHGQRDGRAARAAASWSTPSAARRPRGAAAARGRPARVRRRPAARPARRAPRRRARASTIEPATAAAPRARTPPGSPASPPSACSPSSRRVVAAPDPRAALRAAWARSAITAAILPELEALRGVEQSVYHHRDVLRPHARGARRDGPDRARPGRGRAARGTPTRCGRCSPSRSPTGLTRGARRCASPRCCTTSPSRRPAAQRADGRGAGFPGHDTRGRRDGARRAAPPARVRAARRLRRRAHAPPPAPRLPRPRAPAAPRAIHRYLVADRARRRRRHRLHGRRPPRHARAQGRARRSPRTSSSPTRCSATRSPRRAARRAAAPLVRGDELAAELGHPPGPAARGAARRARGGAVRGGGRHARGGDRASADARGGLVARLAPRACRVGDRRIDRLADRASRRAPSSQSTFSATSVGEW